MRRELPQALDTNTSYKLSKVKQKDTWIEMAVRAVLYDQGISYRTRNSDLPGSPDIANRKRRWAIFVHGCYWHHHKGCSKATIPKNNKEFWVKKFQRNIERDQQAESELRALGYNVLTIWECEIKHTTELHKKIKNFYKMIRI